jgi:hypothetical protein
MKRPDLDTLACVTPECQLFGRPDEAHLAVRTVYGPDQLRLRRCRTCGEEFSERRGSALCNTKLPEAKAEEGINQLGEGWSVRAPARRVNGCQETGARRGRVSGRHAERLHERHVRDLRPMAVECDEQWSCGTKSQNAAPTLHGVQRATCGIRPPWPLTASGWGP